MRPQVWKLGGLVCSLMTKKNGTELPDWTRCHASRSHTHSEWTLQQPLQWVSGCLSGAQAMMLPSRRESQLWPSFGLIQSSFEKPVLCSQAGQNNGSPAVRLTSLGRLRPSSRAKERTVLRCAAQDLLTLNLGLNAHYTKDGTHHLAEPKAKSPGDASVHFLPMPCRSPGLWYQLMWISSERL